MRQRQMCCRGRCWGWPGHIIDILAVLATIFGLATSLGLGAQQAAGGLHFLFDTPNAINVQVGIIVGVTAVAVLSVVRGLDGGVTVSYTPLRAHETVLDLG